MNSSVRKKPVNQCTPLRNQMPSIGSSSVRELLATIGDQHFFESYGDRFTWTVRASRPCRGIRGRLDGTPGTR